MYPALNDASCPLAHDFNLSPVGQVCAHRPLAFLSLILGKVHHAVQLRVLLQREHIVTASRTISSMALVRCSILREISPYLTAQIASSSFFTLLSLPPPRILNNTWVRSWERAQRVDMQREPKKRGNTKSGKKSDRPVLHHASCLLQCGLSTFGLVSHRGGCNQKSAKRGSKEM